MFRCDSENVHQESRVFYGWGNASCHYFEYDGQKRRNLRDHIDSDMKRIAFRILVFMSIIIA